MDIGSEINQQVFKSEREKLIINVIYTAARIQNFFRKRIHPHGITTQQYNVLRILRGAKGEPISTLIIKKRMLEPMPDISRLVDRLVSKGLAAKCITQNDKRLVDVTITEKGLMLLDKIEPVRAEMEAMLMDLLPTQAEQASQSLDILRGGLMLISRVK